ncbi:hypothetical protein DET54_111131 [Paenibacillus pabuli]|uniref:Uncharacterized protein n=1 Tax=Paenibacillus pabuli TaxID=1472 RepID=A0ABX9BGK8_9BACL|nr:hypothetical protein DET54_111131 [Paenibacillus pabuli]
MFNQKKDGGSVIRINVFFIVFIFCQDSQVHEGFIRSKLVHVMRRAFLGYKK